MYNIVQYSVNYKLIVYFWTLIILKKLYEVKKRMIKIVKLILKFNSIINISLNEMVIFLYG